VQKLPQLLLRVLPSAKPMMKSSVAEYLGITFQSTIVPLSAGTGKKIFEAAW
jgi:hypothetical protein